MDMEAVRLKFIECFRFADLSTAAGQAWDFAINGQIKKAVLYTGGVPD
jgi:hypothetical protein